MALRPLFMVSGDELGGAFDIFERSLEETLDRVTREGLLAA